MLDRSRMVRIFRRLRISGFRDGNRLHGPYFTSDRHSNFRDWSQENPVFQLVAAYAHSLLTMAGGSSEPDLFTSLSLPTGCWRLGVEPVLGRSFLPGEDKPGRETVAVISHGLWQRRFGAGAVTGCARHFKILSWWLSTFRGAAESFRFGIIAEKETRHERDTGATSDQILDQPHERAALG